MQAMVSRHLRHLALMSTDKLQYDDDYWKEILEKDIRRLPLEKKLHLVFSLVGHLFSTIFDNINIYLRQFQQRVTNQNSMIHTTNCAVIALDEEGIDIPRAENLEIKLKLHGKRVNVTYQDLRPNASDNEHISQAFTSLITEMIARYTNTATKPPFQPQLTVTNNPTNKIKN